MGLNPRQERFCQEYLVDLNGSAAYRRAYPKCGSDACAKSHAHKLIQRPHVAARIAELQRERAARTTVTADWALRRLVAEAEFYGKGASHPARVSAIGLAMRHLGMFVEDAPHPDRPRFDLTKLTDDQKRGLLAGLRLALGGAADGTPPVLLGRPGAVGSVEPAPG